MDENIEQKGINDNKSKDDELDLTKDAFFSDLLDSEEEITTEASELVEHALSLVDAFYYDDAIEILRQAVALYDQIGKTFEMESIKQKISEIYVLKEQDFIKVDVKTANESNLPDKINNIEELEEQAFETQQKQVIKRGDLLQSKEALINEAQKLIEINNFDEAIEKYDEAIKLLKKMNKNSEIERVYELIDHCYDLKAKFLKKPKKEHLKKEDDVQKEKKEEKIKRFTEIENKNLDNEAFQNQIVDMVNEADKLERDYNLEIKRGNFDAVVPYTQILNIYKDVYKMLVKRRWGEQAKIYANQIRIIQNKLEKDKKLRLIEAQKLRKRIEYEELLKFKKDVGIMEKFSKNPEIEIIKEEDDSQIEDAFKLIQEAENIVRNYELKLRLEKNILEYDSPYNYVISLYKEANKIFQKHGWKRETSQIINTIKFYKEKQKSDENLRALEQNKLKKSKIPQIALKTSAKIDKKQNGLDFKQIKREEDLVNEAFALIDQAEKLAQKYEYQLKLGKFLECPYESIINIYQNARKKFEKIGWKEQAFNLLSTITYYKEKIEADNKLRALEASKFKKRQEILEEQKDIVNKARKKKEVLSKLKSEALISKSKDITSLETQKEHAFRLMDEAKRQLIQNKFNEAIKLYKESENIFSKINWSEGLKIVKESVILIKEKKEEFEIKRNAIKEKEAKQLILEEQSKKEITKIEDFKKSEIEQKRKELFRIQKQKEHEKNLSERAYNLLEQGTKLLNLKKFEEASNKYHAAREIFKQIKWFHEVSRINNELLFKLRLEAKKFERFKAYKKNKIKEEKEIEMLLKEAEKQRIELKKTQLKEKREKLIKAQISDKIKDKIKEKLNQANIKIVKFRYNEGIIIFKDVIKMMEKIGWEKEIDKIHQQIHILRNKSQVPLIALEEIKDNENMDKFELAYKALDKAQMSLLKNQFMKAISELNEAKFNLKETIIGGNFNEEIENIIENYRVQIEKKKRLRHLSDKKGIQKKELESTELSADLAYEYMDRGKKHEKLNDFNKAIEFATKAKEIFFKLGIEWSHERDTINQYINTLKSKKKANQKSFNVKKKELDQKVFASKREQAELRAKIKARREERRKKIQELMKKKNND